jgi:hypothetical protein
MSQPTECPFCRIEHKAVVPTVHLNGTSTQALLADLTAALEALRAARQRVRMAAPNARDYYPQGAAATALAMEQHDRHLAGLKAVSDEIEEMLDHVQAVADFQTAQRRAR